MKYSTKFDLGASLAECVVRCKDRDLHFTTLEGRMKVLVITDVTNIDGKPTNAQDFLCLAVPALKDADAVIANTKHFSLAYTSIDKDNDQWLLAEDIRYEDEMNDEEKEALMRIMKSITTWHTFHAVPPSIE